MDDWLNLNPKKDAKTHSAPQLQPGWNDLHVSEMNVRLYFPKTAAKFSQGRALMLNLHGCWQENTDLSMHGNWQATADEYGMVIAFPKAPGGGVGMQNGIFEGCWAFFGGFQGRNKNHTENVIALAQDLRDRVELNIDPAQIYISGMSSGAGQTVLTACAAPDVFAGFATSGGPTIGISENDNYSLNTNPEKIRTLCRSLAESHASDFRSQIGVVLHGSEDAVVDPRYASTTANAFAELFEARKIVNKDLSTVAGTANSGTRRFWQDSRGDRIVLIIQNGLRHDWPAGNGKTGNHITGTSIDYPKYLTSFLFENNRRVKR